MVHVSEKPGHERALLHRRRAAMLLEQMEAARDENLRLLLLQMAQEHFRLAQMEELQVRP